MIDRRVFEFRDPNPTLDSSPMVIDHRKNAVAMTPKHRKSVQHHLIKEAARKKRRDFKGL